MSEKIQVKEIKDKNIWETFVLSQNPKSFLQSWNWGETHLKLGFKIIRLGFYGENVLLGICLIIVHKARRGKHLTISGGPLLDWKNKNLVRQLLNTLRKLAGEEKAWFVRVRPEIDETPYAQMLFNGWGFINAPMHLDAENTWIIDLKGSDDEILKRMRKTTRYLIKKGLTQNYKVYTTVDLLKLEILADLQKETISRHKFVGFSKSMFISELQTFAGDNQAELFILESKGIPMVAAIIIYYGNCAYYHFSASSDRSRNTPASYVLQWEIIKRAKERGIEFYNMWGIAKTENQKHRFYGVTTFKKGFGGKQYDWLHAKDLVINPLYILTWSFENIRKFTRRLS